MKKKINKLAAVGAAVYRARHDKRLSQQEAAALAGISLDAWGRIERGDRNNPSVQTLAKMAAALGVEIRSLIDVVEVKNDPPEKAADLLQELWGMGLTEKDIISSLESVKRNQRGIVT